MISLIRCAARHWQPGNMLDGLAHRSKFSAARRGVQVSASVPWLTVAGSEYFGVRAKEHGARKWARGARSAMAILNDQNLCWSRDFVMDRMVSGRRFRIPLWLMTSPGSASARWRTHRSALKGDVTGRQLIKINHYISATCEIYQTCSWNEQVLDVHDLNAIRMLPAGEVV